MALLVLLNGALAAYATPISDWLDPTEYIQLSRSFLGQATDVNLAHRSPLFSLVLAGFMLLLKPPLLYKAAVIFQYALLVFTSWMVYGLFQRVFSARWPAMFTALLFNLSFATIFYANLIQTEIITVFLVVWSVVILMKMEDQGKFIQFFALGAVVGLIALARFSAVPLVVTYFVLLLIILFRKKAPAKKWALSTGMFLAPYLFVINAWCLYNQVHHGFYGLFPHSGQGVSRNITVASVRPEYKVSAANQPILEIFLKAKETYLEESKSIIKGFLVKLDKNHVLALMYGGYNIYLEALPGLRQHFGLPAAAGEYELSTKLAGFYEEVSSQNQAFVLQFRFISFLNGLRVAENGSLPSEYGQINLNFLPNFLFKIYRFAFMGISLFVFFAFFYFIAKGIRNRWSFEFTLLAMFLLVFSFWGINFAFVTAADASRFKFPAEPFILGLFVYYAALIGKGLAGRYGARLQQRQTEVK